MNPPPPDLSTSGHRDRKNGLILFGVLTLLLGGICAMFLPLMILGQAMAAKTTGVPANNLAVIPAVAVYGFLAVALLWLGVGSIQARRWARALLLIFSWAWLVMGVITIGFMLIWLPQTTGAFQPPGRPPLPEAAVHSIQVMILLILGVIFLILPGAWVLFYRSPHVKATCEARDPEPCWTDACPLPVLGVSVWLVLGGVSMLFMPLGYHGVMAFFGTFISGFTGALGYLVLAVVWFYSAWALYRRDVRGWWLVFVTFWLFVISSALTYSRHDLTELYQLMGYSEPQITQITRVGFVNRSFLVWGTVAMGIVVGGYLLGIKRLVPRSE